MGATQLQMQMEAKLRRLKVLRDYFLSGSWRAAADIYGISYGRAHQIGRRAFGDIRPKLVSLPHEYSGDQDEFYKKVEHYKDNSEFFLELIGSHIKFIEKKIGAA